MCIGDSSWLTCHKVAFSNMVWDFEQSHRDGGGHISRVGVECCIGLEIILGIEIFGIPERMRREFESDSLSILSREQEGSNSSSFEEDSMLSESTSGEEDGDSTTGFELLQEGGKPVGRSVGMGGVKPRNTMSIS